MPGDPIKHCFERWTLSDPLTTALITAFLTKVADVALGPWITRRNERARLEEQSKAQKGEVERNNFTETLEDAEHYEPQVGATPVTSSHVELISQEDAYLVQKATGYSILPEERRGLIRMVKEEGIRQKNMENIALAAADRLNENAKPEEMDDDWIRKFFEYGRNISDESVQKFWSEMLAGEANVPGSFSIKTIEILKSMGTKDVLLFNDLCQYTIFIDDLLFLVVYDHEPIDAMYQVNGRQLVKKDLSWLAELGLITANNAGYFWNTRSCRPKRKINYCDEEIIIKPNTPEQNVLGLGSYGLTISGEELWGLCKISFNQEFFSEIQRSITSKGF